MSFSIAVAYSVMAIFCRELRGEQNPLLTSNFLTIRKRSDT